MMNWDPSPFIFSWNIPLLGRPLLWYGAFFALGCFLSYFLLILLLKREKKPKLYLHARKITDDLSLYLLVGILLGARLFDILFYEHLNQLSHLFCVWEGGLSSHGGVIGALIAVFIYQKRYTYFTLRHLCDLLSVVAGVVAAFIRIGNFFNQEILGTPSHLPWAVVFGHPIDGSFPIARHPVQLYEACFYLAIAGVMWFLKNKIKVEGRLCGLFLLTIFTFRFLIEFLKEEQSVWFHSFLTMGQWLSLPMIVLGVILLRNRSFQ